MENYIVSSIDGGNKMSYKNLKTEEVIERIQDLQDYLMGQRQEPKFPCSEILGALEYAKETVSVLKRA